MVKAQKTFLECETPEEDIYIGQKIILVLTNGQRILTSPILNYYLDCHGAMKIETKNSIYVKY